MFRFKTMESHLFQSSSFSWFGYSQMLEVRGVATLQKPRTISDAEAGDLILRFRNENKAGARDFLQCLFAIPPQQKSCSFP